MAPLQSMFMWLFCPFYHLQADDKKIIATAFQNMIHVHSFTPILITTNQPYSDFGQRTGTGQLICLYTIQQLSFQLENILFRVFF